jgi:hypothetical protein
MHRTNALAAASVPSSAPRAVGGTKRTSTRCVCSAVQAGVAASPPYSLPCEYYAVPCCAILFTCHGLFAGGTDAHERRWSSPYLEGTAATSWFPTAQRWFLCARVRTTHNMRQDFATTCARTLPHLHQDFSTSAPRFIHICTGTYPHLHRDFATSAPGLCSPRWALAGTDGRGSTACPVVRVHVQVRARVRRAPEHLRRTQAKAPQCSPKAVLPRPEGSVA